MTNRLIWGLLAILGLGLTPQMAWAKKATANDRHPACAAPDVGIIELQREARLLHARELLGKYYSHSTVRVGENVKRINSQIFAWTKQRLPARFKKDYKRVAQAIIDESVKREFDPVFVMSVIQNESSFNPLQRGSLDEIGLMQLRPGTAAWVAPKYGLKFRGERSLKDPVENIKLGTAYMDYLRGRFDSQAQLYISAYNMGGHNVERALEKNIRPKDYAGHVMHFYVDFYADLRKTVKRKKRVTVIALNK